MVCLLRATISGMQLRCLTACIFTCKNVVCLAIAKLLCLAPETVSMVLQTQWCSRSHERYLMACTTLQGY